MITEAAKRGSVSQLAKFLLHWHSNWNFPTHLLALHFYGLSRILAQNWDAHSNCEWHLPFSEYRIKHIVYRIIRIIHIIHIIREVWLSSYFYADIAASYVPVYANQTWSFPHMILSTGPQSLVNLRTSSIYCVLSTCFIHFMYTDLFLVSCLK